VQFVEHFKQFFVPKRKFDEELLIKHRLYYFILSNDLFTEFLEFEQENRGKNMHQDVINWFIERLPEEEINAMKP
jgi:hypothetical protein